jgi:hypothetical protein
LLAAPIVVPVGLILAIWFAPLALVMWLDGQRRARLRAKGWHVWFAWRPVKTGPWWDRGGWVWLEMIERNVSRENEYRLPGAEV